MWKQVSASRCFRIAVVLWSAMVLIVAARLCAAPPATTRAGVQHRSVLEAVRPLGERLPRGNGVDLASFARSGRDIGMAYVSLDPPFVQAPHPERRKQAEQATLHMVGLAGTDGTLQGEAVSFTIITFSDAETAREMPAWMAEGFRSMLPLLKASGISIRRLDAPEPRGITADAVRMLRASGRDTDAKQPWTNVQLRATRGSRMVELVLRNVEMPEEEMVALVNDALDQVTPLPPDAPPDAEPQEEDATQ